MNITQSAFRGEVDLSAMVALAREDRAGNLHVLDLPYRLSSWALDEPANIGLWRDEEGQLVAWAVLQAPFWTVDLAVHPGAGSELRRRALTWAVRRARVVAGTPAGRPAWYAHIFADQDSSLQNHEEAGFTRDEAWSRVLLRRSEGLPLPDWEVPAGFVVRPLAGEAEIEAYVALHQAVFESRNMTPAWRARVLRRPEYRPDLDLVAVAPDGQMAGFWVGWFGPGNATSVGQIEPFGVAAAYRGIGLGQALLAEGLRRLSGAGAKEMLVETEDDRGPALALYHAAGFRDWRAIRVLRRESSQS